MPDPNDTTTAPCEAAHFPVDGGMVGALIRERDWSSTPLGPIATWPEALRISVQNALNTSFPMAVAWGPELYQLYNDSFAKLMGDKHPDGLGQRARDNWSEAWRDTGPLFEHVLHHGEPIQRTEMPFVIDRHGFSERAYFTFSYSPISNRSGETCGILVTVTETTEQIIYRRRLKTLSDLGTQLSLATDSADLLHRAMNIVGDNRDDIPFALLYAQDVEQDRADLLEALHIDRGTTWSPSWIDLPPHSSPDDPIARCLIESRDNWVDLRTTFGDPPDSLCATYPIARRAWVAPLMVGPSADPTCVGCFVLGINPTIEFSDDYGRFLTELARNISVAYANTRESEQELDMARTRAEMARQKAESRHLRQRSQLLDSLGRPFYGLDRQWHIIYANRAARQDPHWSADKVTGQNLWELFPWSRGTRAETYLRQAMDTGEPVEFEYSMPVNERIYEIRAFSWEQGLSVSFLDITEQRRTAQALERSEARFRAVVEASLDVIAITDRSGEFKFVSPAAASVLGEPPQDLESQSLFDILPPEGAYTARGAYTKLLHDDSTFLDFRAPIDRGDEQGWLSIKSKNMLTREGVEGILLNIRDITDIHRFESELIEARERAEEMTRLKSSILTNMSHEIRTPLTSIIGMANVLASQVAEEHRSFAEKIERGGMRLSQTLDSVLTLAQIEGKAIDLNLSDVHLVREVRAAVQSLKNLALEKGLELRIVTGEKPIICVDSTFLVSILNNLIGNAIKFTDEGSITVRVDGDARRGIITVEDTGIGIDPDFIPHVFDEFRQESTGLARSHQGAGLGLTITRRMVDAMQGTITVCSTKGVGSTFTITFPRNRPQPLGATDTNRDVSPPLDPGDCDLPSVLVVEDDETIREMLPPILEPDFDVTAVADAQSALVKAMRRHFDVIVLDIGLPDMDGLEALHHLQSIPGYEKRPIVALTGYAMPGDRRRFIDEGFSDHIPKPFAPDELKNRLEQLVMT